jgi:hypothetical protein
MKTTPKPFFTSRVFYAPMTSHPSDLGKYNGIIRSDSALIDSQELEEHREEKDLSTSVCHTHRDSRGFRHQPFMLLWTNATIYMMR